MGEIRGASTRVNRDMVIAKDPKTTGNIHYGRSALTRFRARVYTFLDHPRYQKNYWFYLPALLYHIVIFIIMCVASLVLEMYDDTWLREFTRYKFDWVDFDVKEHAQRLGMVGSMFLILEYPLRIWSCVSNSKYGGDQKEMNPVKIRAAHTVGRKMYALEFMNIFELLVTLILFCSYFIYCPHPHVRFIAFVRAVHWDKSVHALRLIKKIATKGYRYIVPCWAFGFILMALHSCAVFTCEKYYRLENATTQESDVDDLGNALWYTYVTSMSIGYGDFTPKTGFCRGLSFTFGYASNILFFSVQTAVSLFLVKHIADENDARMSIKVQNLAAKLIQTWVRFHMARRKMPASDKWTEICCQKLYRAKQKIEQQRRVAGMITPAKRLIKRAKRTSLMRQISGDSVRDAYAPPAAALARKRGSLPNHLHSLFSMTAATAAVFANRNDSPDSAPLTEEGDYYSVQNTVDERFLRMHANRSGVSSLSRCKTTREEFGPLVLMIHFLLFGHYKRRFKNTEFRKPPEKKVQDEQDKLTVTVRDVEKQFEQLVLRSEARDKETECLEKVVQRILATAENLSNKVRTTEDIVHPVDKSHPDVRKRKATLIEIGKQDSGEQEMKRKNTIL